MRMRLIEATEESGLHFIRA